MKKTWLRFSTFAIAIALLAPLGSFAQKDDKDDKGEKEKKDVQQIIITNKAGKGDKVIVEIDGDNVKVNGKPLEDYKDEKGDIKVRVSKVRDMESLAFMRNSRNGAWSYNSDDDNYRVFTDDENRAMLGVTTEKVDEGASVQDITKGSAAEKIGLKENDIITKIDDKKIEGPDDLSEAVKAHKPGDKVSITYLRDKKEQKATAELTKWKGMSLWGEGQNYNLNMGNLQLDKIMPQLKTMQGMRTPYVAQGWNWSGNGPKLGLSIQDTDDGKGAKVIEVDEESNAAKAGIKEDDIITQVDDKAVNTVDDVTKLIREKKESASIKLQITRNGKSQNIEVKMPRKIKTADL
jgi:serine protease Do